jgi:hypothetical protein
MDSFDQLTALSAQIAEEKKAIGNLWNKVDELQVSSANDIEYLSKQISEWTQTNLQLMKLLAAKTEETERLAQNSSLLTSTLDELKTQFAQSQQPTTKLSNFSENLPVLADTKAEILVQQLSSSQAVWSQSNELLKGLLKILLSKSRTSDLERLREMARNGEEINPEEIPQTIDWGMARIYLLQDIANFLKAPLTPYLLDLKEEIKSLKELTSIASPPSVTRKFASFATTEMAAIVVGVLSVLTLNGWLGAQIGNLQARSDPSYQQAMEIWQLNQAQLEKARAEGRKKSTIWLVPDHLR